ncbi:hypothetical protein J7T55_004360 [Diaporthe amygdali]|uniref:uncharacterized protein n=1 Tax=Phomopsis amygdali TaxID=1214568 RepID=UPI0022FE11EF|nr:uncharacterized protein J7T55_004360 [Diaporthe amygdali]KAJ0109810.1 hypothetical protein J7T55_004360 [Diaporthe amygdali]
MAAAFIRPYKSSDFAATAHICRATLPPTLAASEPATRLAPYIWTHQYTLLSPATCFVLDDGSGAAVGYVIGCADVFALADAYPRYISEILAPAETSGVPVPKQLARLEPWLVPGDGGKGGINEECLAQMAHSPRWLLLEGVQGKAELVRDFRATMHIDLLEGWQGKGWGRKMIERFMASVKDGVEGVTMFLTYRKKSNRPLL